MDCNSLSNRRVLTQSDATGVLSEAMATVEDNDELDDFSPHVLHKPHTPFPIAMVSRKPHGSKSYRYAR